MNWQQIFLQQWLNSKLEFKKIQQDKCVQNMVIPTYS